MSVVFMKLIFHFLKERGHIKHSYSQQKEPKSWEGLASGRTRGQCCTMRHNRSTSKLGDFSTCLQRSKPGRNSCPGSADSKLFKWNKKIMNAHFRLWTAKKLYNLSASSTVVSHTTFSASCMTKKTLSCMICLRFSPLYFLGCQWSW